MPEGLLDQRFSAGASHSVVGLARFSVLEKSAALAPRLKPLTLSPLKRALRSIALHPGRKTPGLATLRESRVNAAKGNGDASNLRDNTDYEMSLERRKVCPILPDPDAERDDYVRIIDETGEDYLFPANPSYF